MNDEKKMTSTYSKIYYFTSLLHVFYVAVFIQNNCIPLVIYNVISIVLYIALGTSARTAKRLNTHFAICFVEILLNSVLSTMLVGLDSGFMLYLIAIMPLLFYSIHMLFKKDLKESIVFCIVIMAMYYMAVLLDMLGSFRITELDEGIEHVLYMVNLSSAFVILIGFLLVFVSKVDVEKEELTQEKNEMANSANYDALTNLLNRRSFDKYMSSSIEAAITENNGFSVLMCDIDDFKKVNDTYGHDCGDKVLINVAEKLKGTVRGNDVVFRWGGEEMLILLAVDGEIAEQVAQRCRKAVESSEVVYNGQTVKVTITIGGCSYVTGLDQERMISKADENLYQGKSNGKNQVVF